MNQRSIAYVPKGRFAKWFESRLPLGGLIHSSFVAFPVPRNLTYLWTFGGVLAFMLLEQITTGIWLAMYYKPDAKLAFASVEHIMRDVNYGWLLRYAHANGVSVFFLAVYIHIFRNLYYGSYKAPREVLYLIGVVIFLLMMATAFLGYVLPWGQESFWGATVITNVFSAIPLIGNTLVSLLWGGYTVGDPTLNRFFSLHYLLPFMIVGMVILHLWALHVPGNNNPTGIPIKSGKDAVPFHPFMTVKDGFAVIISLILLCWLVFYMPNYTLAADNYIPANPAVTPAEIVPQWYFLPFYAILRAVPDKLGGVIAMFGAVFVLALVPWLDTSPVRSASYRPLYRQFFWILVLVCVALGWLGAMPPTGGYVVSARICTVYYFAHFLIIMPIVGLFETPAKMPGSILESALGSSTSPARADQGSRSERLADVLVPPETRV
jgi:ubiquinol-cytochrome c reductase cytochrome b subunit